MTACSNETSRFATMAAMGNATQRQYPRIAIDHPGSLAAKVLGNEQITLPVAIRSISCEGVGLVLGNRDWPLKVRAPVRVNFKIDQHHDFDLPGVIVWLANPRDTAAPLDVGVWFQLALAANATRQTYARWIVDLLRTSGPARTRAFLR